MNKLHLKFSFGNSKLKKDNIVSFGLIPIKTCIGASYCKLLCYATQGGYTYPNTIKARNFNYKASLKDSFVNKAIKDLNRIKAKYIRLHDSGDFYNQKYLDNWIKIINNFPNKIFYAYTKSLNLDFSKKPNNFIIIQSLGGLFDNLIDYNKPHAKIFDSFETMQAQGYISGNDSDMIAISGIIKIGLVYHGTRNLTNDLKEILNKQ